MAWSLGCQEAFMLMLSYSSFPTRHSLSPFSVTLAHQHVPVTAAVFLPCRVALSLLFHFVLPAWVSWLWVEHNLPASASGFRVKAASEISSPSWFPFTLAFVCSGSCRSVQKVASPRESDLELNPPLAVLIHTSQCWQPSSPDTFRHILEKYLFV